jgi:hypothetical protein
MSYEIKMPVMEDFEDADGYIDFEDYDVAMDQWRMQFPDLRESWCGDRMSSVNCDSHEDAPSLTDILQSHLQ